LKDFPRANFICSQDAFDDVKNKRNFSALRRGFLPELLPNDFTDKCRFLQHADFTKLPAHYFPFEQGVDVFGDQSMWAVRLEGHAKGQMGLFVKTKEREVFLVADAAWHSRTLREGILPRQTVRLFISSWREYVATFEKVRMFQAKQPEVMIVPSHCSEIYETLVRKGVVL
jgi:glyoxylase-like metal-dependent hydrolase (beta-lactamase superfamily II)